MKLTHAHKTALYKLGSYRFNVPPVTPGNWAENDWINYINHWSKLKVGITDLIYGVKIQMHHNGWNFLNQDDQAKSIDELVEAGHNREQLHVLRDIANW